MNRTAVEQIKERIPIEDLIGQYVKLEKAGKSFKARCPFHNEKSASFFVSPERGGYYCFGCNAKGDIFTFVEQFEGLDFRGALKILAERAGVQLTYDKKADGERDRLFQIMEDAAKFFESHLEKSKEVQEYVKGRGINDETKASFRIGWVPEGWQNLLNYLKAKGWNEAVMEKAGLIKMKEGNELGVHNSTPSRYYDRFRGRVMFPIGDSSGRVIAFSGRILKDDGKSAKYLNSPDTPLFDKSLVLYGLDKAKSEIRRLNYTVMVEGQMDLVLSHQAGVKNTVASSGTALTDETKSEAGIVSNLGLVKRLSPNIILALDSDKAGKTAAMRAVAIVALSLGMSVKIADIEGGKDPADLIKSDPKDWENVLRNSKHVIVFELDNILKDIQDANKRARAVRDRLFPFLARIERETDKADFVKMIAEKLAISETAVWEDLRRAEKEMKAPDQKAVQSNSSAMEKKSRIDLVERRMFGLLSLMDTAKFPKAAEYREEIKKISGDSYAQRIQRVEPLMSDLVFEAEAFFGGDTTRWDFQMKELTLNFEEDMINEELMKAMQDVRIAEKEGRQDDMNALAQKCQALSIRKAEVGKRRRQY